MVHAFFVLINQKHHFMKKNFLASFFAMLSLCANAQDFYIDGILYKITGLYTVEVSSGDYYFGEKYTGDIVIPNKITDERNEIEFSVTSIGEKAFDSCSGLTSISIPKSVASIGNAAFQGCTGLTSISIPESVTSIGAGAFDGCTGLTSISIPESVTSIGARAFSVCRGLKSINIPSSVTSIEKSTFMDCI